MLISPRRTIALISAVVMLFLTACTSGKASTDKKSNNLTPYPYKSNTTVSSDSKWYSSSIEGAIDSTLEVSENDDFYTAINKDWLLSQEVTPDNENIFFATEAAETVKQRKIDILSGDVEPNENFEGADIYELEHDRELVRQFSSTAADWETRNSLGAEPLRKYIDAIEAIETTDDLTAYLCDITGNNFTGSSFLDLQVISGVVDNFNCRMTIAPCGDYLLEDTSQYKNIGLFGMVRRDDNAKLITAVLSALGYTAEQTEALLVSAYQFEGSLVDHDDTIGAEVLLFEDIVEGRSLEELECTCGAFPIKDILASRGMDKAEEYHFCAPGYLGYLGSMYNTDNLDSIKAYLITHAAKKAAPLLSRDLYDIYKGTEKTNNTKMTDDGTGVGKTENKDDWDIVLNDFVTPYMSGALDIVYCTQYCSPGLKSDIQSLISEILDAYHVMISEEDWMSEDAKNATIEKLDYMTVRAVYPDTFENYNELSFSPGDTLLDMVRKINVDNTAYAAGLIDLPVDKSRWDMDDMSTTGVNAYYNPTDNSINIMAGILASESVYSEDQTKEQRLATIGCIIGHEITHAFDNNGCKYDKYGVENNWWDLDDLTAFQLRTVNLINFYSARKAYTNSSSIAGTRIEGEAIADMGGMKATLIIAKGINDFDYDQYFRSFAQMWRQKLSYSMASHLATNDVHPLNDIRTNATVMQFDEFVETYNIMEGDGMYLAPEERISVW